METKISVQNNVQTLDELGTMDDTVIQKEISDLHYWLTINHCISPNESFLEVLEAKKLKLEKFNIEALRRGLKIAFAF